MAQRKPLVLDASLKIQQLQAGDTLATNPDNASATFTSTVVAGEAVYGDAPGSVDQGLASAAASSKVIGLAPAGVTAAATGDYTYDGIVTLTTGEWDVVTGETGGLTVDLNYYLDDGTAGHMLQEDNVATLLTGDSRVLIGTAISTTEIQLNIQEPILL